MPKSKLRGGKKAHNKRVQERNLIKKRKDEKAQRLFMDQLKEIQEAAMVEQEQEVVNVDEMGDIGEFELEDAEIVSETTEETEEKPKDESSDSEKVV